MYACSRFYLWNWIMNRLNMETSWNAFFISGCSLVQSECVLSRFVFFWFHSDAVVIWCIVSFWFASSLWSSHRFSHLFFLTLSSHQPVGYLSRQNIFAIKPFITSSQHVCDISEWYSKSIYNNSVRFSVFPSISLSLSRSLTEQWANASHGFLLNEKEVKKNPKKNDAHTN